MPCNPLSQTDAAYIAGLLDGEGTVSATIHPREDGAPGIDAYVVISNSHRETIRWVKQCIGIGSLQKTGSRKSGHKPMLAVVVTIGSVASLLHQLLPFLKIKRQQAEIVLAIVDRVYPSRLDHNDTRKELVASVQLLNRRGTNLVNN